MASKRVSAILSICFLLTISFSGQVQPIYLENLGHYSAVMTKFIDRLLEKASYLADVIIANSLHEQCQAVCLKNINQASKSNKTKGCAIFGLEVRVTDLPSIDMLSCCEKMTSCYSKCGQDKLICDVKFQDCLNDLCKNKFSETMDQYSTCQLSNKILIIGNLAFGCKEYKQLQSESCCFKNNTFTDNSLASITFD